MRRRQILRIIRKAASVLIYIYTLLASQVDVSNTQKTWRAHCVLRT